MPVTRICAAMGWHPNLFGPGNPGIFIWAVLRFFAFNLASGTFSVLNPSNFSNDDPYANRSTGQALYLPATDQLICFAKTQAAVAGIARCWWTLALEIRPMFSQTDWFH